MLKHGEVLTFNRKVFVYEKPLGSGGTGDTHLVKDETTGMLFAIKKFTPVQEEFREELYKRFVDEIKILFLLTHPNVVRIFNYYLYPEQQTGYIQMEYIEGTDVETHLSIMSNDFDGTFIQILNGFLNLEKNGILHRDIRPANIMVTYDDTVKILDFGFGKKLENSDDVGESVLLNWPVSTLPDEVRKENKYTLQSEIYFVGKMFRKVLEVSSEDQQFKYRDVLTKMVQLDPTKRYKSFNDILEEISNGTLADLDFFESEKTVYQNFADAVISHLNLLHGDFSPTYDIQATLSMLEKILNDSALEQYIQANNKLLRCFINTGYNYSSKKDIPTTTVKKFYELLKGKKYKAQRVILDNLYTRISTIPVREIDDLPF